MLEESWWIRGLTGGQVSHRVQGVSRGLRGAGSTWHQAGGAGEACRDSSEQPQVTEPQVTPKGNLVGSVGQGRGSPGEF